MEKAVSGAQADCPGSPYKLMVVTVRGVRPHMAVVEAQ